MAHFIFLKMSTKYPNLNNPTLSVVVSNKIVVLFKMCLIQQTIQTHTFFFSSEKYFTLYVAEVFYVHCHYQYSRLVKMHNLGLTFNILKKFYCFIKNILKLAFYFLQVQSREKYD